MDVLLPDSAILSLESTTQGVYIYITCIGQSRERILSLKAIYLMNFNHSFGIKIKKKNLRISDQLNVNLLLTLKAKTSQFNLCINDYTRAG
jgi:hypothetical protein